MAITDLRDQLDTDMATTVGAAYSGSTYRPAFVNGVWTVIATSIVTYLNAYRHLPASGVVPGIYTNATVQVNDEGIITAASSGAAGVTSHPLLSNLGWTVSGHTGTAGRIAGFDGGGAAAEYQIGVDLQAYSSRLATIAGLGVTNGNFIVGNGATWVVESGNTARTSLGLGTGDSPTFTNLTLSGDLYLGSSDQVRWSTATRIYGTPTDLYIEADDDLYLDADDDLRVCHAGVEYAHFDGGVEGLYIGGSSVPSERLHVGSGNIRLDSGYRVQFGGDTTYIDGVHDGTLTPNGATYCYIYGITGDVKLEAGDDVILHATDDVWIWGGGAAWSKFDGTYQRLGVGTGTSTPSYPLDVKATTTGYMARLDNQSTSAYADGLWIDIQVASCGGNNHYVDFHDAGGNVGEIEGDGVGGIAYRTTSDRRLKEDIKDAQSMLPVLGQLRVREWRWKRNGERGVGFVAQELAEVWPTAATRPEDVERRNSRRLCQIEVQKTRRGEVVWEAAEELLTVEEMDALPPGRRIVSSRPITEADQKHFSYLGVDFSRLVPVLTGSLQEVVQQLEDQERRLAEQETRLEDQAEQLAALTALVNQLTKKERKA